MTTHHLPHIALLPEGGRILQPLIGAKDHQGAGGNTIWLETPTGNADLFLYRHQDEFDKKHRLGTADKWTGYECRRDDTGKMWHRTVHFVVGDFAELVEVPA